MENEVMETEDGPAGFETETAGGPVRLTRREIEVLTLVIEGKSSKEVADHIYVSKRTVDFHLANIYKKLDVSNRVQAFREATRRNLLPAVGFLGMSR